jgi:hypothetical protein
LPSWPLIAALAVSVTPADQASGNITTYILGYGVTGIAALTLAWLFWKGWRLMSPAREAEIVNAAREQARADLLSHVGRLEKQAEQAEREKKDIADQRDEALRYVQVNLVPLLLNFTSATSALVPILQELVRHQEGGGSIDPRRRR